VVDDLVRSWRDEITRLDPRLRELVIVADHGDFWHISFELGEEYHDVAAADVPQRIVRLFS
jgi:hypothetical protein